MSKTSSGGSVRSVCVFLSTCLDLDTLMGFDAECFPHVSKLCGSILMDLEENAAMPDLRDEVSFTDSVLQGGRDMKGSPFDFNGSMVR